MRVQQRPRCASALRKWCFWAFLDFVRAPRAFVGDFSETSSRKLAQLKFFTVLTLLQLLFFSTALSSISRLGPTIDTVPKLRTTMHQRQFNGIN